MPKNAADILRGGGESTPLKELVGSQITLVDYEVKNGRHGEFVVFDAITDGGEEISVRGGEHLVSKFKKLEKAGLLEGLEVKVVSFETNFGNDGYGLDPVDGD